MKNFKTFFESADDIRSFDFPYSELKQESEKLYHVYDVVDFSKAVATHVDSNYKPIDLMGIIIHLDCDAKAYYDTTTVVVTNCKDKKDVYKRFKKQEKDKNAYKQEYLNLQLRRFVDASGDKLLIFSGYKSLNTLKVVASNCKTFDEAAEILDMLNV